MVRATEGARTILQPPKQERGYNPSIPAPSGHPTEGNTRTATRYLQGRNLLTKQATP